MAIYNITSQQLKGAGILNSFELAAGGAFNTYSVAFDGTGNFSLATTLATVADGTFTIAKTTGLQSALDSKVAHASGNGRTITVGNTAPTSPLTDDIWFDTTA